MRGLENLHQDLVFGWRSLRRNPGFVATALVTLSLGIGAATGMFSVVQAVWLRPLPYDDPGRLVAIWSEQRQPSVPEASSAYANIDDWRRSSRALNGVLAYDGTSATITDPSGEVQRLNSALTG